MDSRKNKGIGRREFIEISTKRAVEIGLASFPVLTGCSNIETTNRHLVPVIMTVQIVVAGK